MSSRTGAFRFIDLPTAAERLGTTRNTLLQWVDEGRIKPFTGTGQQSVFRATDVDRLAEELGKAEATPAEQQPQSTSDIEQEPVTNPEAAATVRTRRRDAIKLMGTRLSMDSRWAEMTDKDVATWLDALEPVQFERVRRVCGIAIERLQYVLSELDKQEARLKETRGKSGG